MYYTLDEATAFQAVVKYFVLVPSLPQEARLFDEVDGRIDNRLCGSFVKDRDVDGVTFFKANSKYVHTERFISSEFGIDDASDEARRTAVKMLIEHRKRTGQRVTKNDQDRKQQDFRMHVDLA